MPRLQRRATSILRSFSSLLPALALGGSLATSGCNLNRITANSTSGMLAYGSIAMDREADVEFARYAFPASLKTLETFLVNSPENENLLLLLARGYSSYAFAILEHDLDVAHHTGPDELVDSLERRAKIHYLRGREYGFRLLNRPALEEAARNDDYETLDKELAALSEKDAPGLFWAAYGWSSAINLAKDDASMLTALGTIERLMARMVELDEDYNGGAPLLFHGVYHSAKPAMFGGKPELSKEFFDRAMASHGDSNLLVPFLYARFYCPQVQDRALFDELMGKISAADLTAHPNMRLNNEVARQRAMYWTKHVDEIILEEG